MNAIESIAAERERQKALEGWTDEHDDYHSTGALARAAACYCFVANEQDDVKRAHVDALYGVKRGFSSIIASLWPHEWAAQWFKPKDARRDLVRAGALIVAEIERLDRRAMGKRKSQCST